MLTQAQINPGEGPKAYDEYVKIRYPYLETAKKREKEDTVKVLLEEVSKGPLVIRPMGDPAVKSKLHTKIHRTEHADAHATSERLMKKIGRSMPV
jgi:hypothetical protein